MYPFNKLQNIITFFTKGKSIKGKVAQGGILLSAGNWMEQGFRFIRNMILTRILMPEVFGIMAIILAINTFFESFSEMGIKQAIIQSKQSTNRKYLNAAWWISAIRALVLYGLAYISTPYIAEFYNNPQLNTFLRITFLSILFRGLISIRSYIEIKELRFSRWVIINHFGGILGIFTAIVFAFYLRNVWALIIGFVIENACRFILSYILCPFLPNFKLDRKYLKAVINYTLGMLGLPILTFIFMRIDVFVIGKVCSQFDLGLYSMALTLAYIPLRIVSNLISEILMPVFSKMQDDHNRLNSTLLSVSYLIAFFAAPILIFAIFYGKYVLHLAYGEVYAAVAIPFVIITATNILKLWNAPIVGLYMAIGKPGLHRYITIVRVILIVLFIYPAVKYFGLTGAALAGFVSMFVGYLLQIKRLQQITDINLGRFVSIFLNTILVPLSIGVIWLVSYYAEVENPFIMLSIGIISCIVVYIFGIMIYFKNKRFNESSFFTM